jgi:hypothetical protein
MDPYLGPVAGALLAAFAAGIALGVVRLRRLSLEWRRRASRAGAAASNSAADPPDADGALDLAAAPPVFGALALTALVALLGVAVAARGEFAAVRAATPPPAAVPALPPSWSAFAAQASGLVLVAGLAFLLTLGAALAVSLLDRAVARLLARFAPGERPLAPDAELDVPALVAAAGRTHGPGEPFGVGLASIVLIAATVFAMASLLVALGGGPSPVPAVAVALLVVPVAYAAAAERASRPAAARLRRDAAVRQLAVAPLWGAGLVFAPSPPALAALALAGAVALPGALAQPGTFALPWGGDAAEPSPVVRALSRVAHGAWIAILAALPFVAVAGPVTSIVDGAVLVARILLALVAFLAGRAVLRRFVLPQAEVA